MALQRGRPEEIPEDAVLLSEQEAFFHQRDKLLNWPKSSEVFAFKYGGPFLGLVSGAVGAYLNTFYRRKWKLRSYGTLSSYLPVMCIPAMTSFVFHHEAILPDIVLQKNCVVCTELRASSLQAITGCIIPSILAPLTSVILASQYLTIRLPDITKEPRKVLQFYKVTTQPIANLLFAIFVGQALLASVVTYFEAKSVAKCMQTLDFIEQERQKMLEM